MAVFAAIVLCILMIGNLVNLPWFVWLTIEQIETGWGYSTDMEIMALLPIAVGFLSLPVLLVALIYIVLCLIPAIKQNYLNSVNNHKMFKINVILFIVLILQIVITNVFIWN